MNPPTTMTLDAIRRYSEGLREAGEDVALYQKGMEDKKLKYSLGMATIISLITVANRLDTAQITAIGHHLNYANAVIRLRYETGALLIKEKDQYRVDLERLIQVPDPAMAPSEMT